MDFKSHNYWQLLLLLRVRHASFLERALYLGKCWEVLGSKCWSFWGMTWKMHPGKEWCWTILQTSGKVWSVQRRLSGGKLGARKKEGGGGREEGTEEEELKPPGQRWEDRGTASELSLSRTGGGPAIPEKSDQKHIHLCDCWDLNQTLALAKAASGKQREMGCVPLGRWGAGRVITNTYKCFLLI